MSTPARKLRTARYTGAQSSVTEPLLVSTQLRWMIDMMAIGHSAVRTTSAVLIGALRGRNALRTAPRRPVGIESAAVTPAPYTEEHSGAAQAGQYVSVDGALPLSM